MLHIIAILLILVIREWLFAVLERVVSQASFECMLLEDRGDGGGC